MTIKEERERKEQTYGSFPVIYEEKNVKLRGTWNPPYTGSLKGETLHTPVPQEYEKFLRKHNGGRFMPFYAEKSHGVWSMKEDEELILFDAETAFNNHSVRYIASQWSTVVEPYAIGYTAGGLPDRDASGIYDYFFDTHLVIGYFVDGFDGSGDLLAIDRNGEFLYVQQSCCSDIECIKCEIFKEPIQIENRFFDHAYYTPDGLLFPARDKRTGTSYTIKPYSEFTNLYDVENRANFWLHQEVARSSTLLGLFEENHELFEAPWYKLMS